VGVFPSFSAGWRLSEESFIKNLSLFSNLKLRASYGSLGNQSIGSDFPYVSSIGLGWTNYIIDKQIVSGAAPSVLPNKDIKWETTDVADIGIDAGVLNQRLTFSFDYYKRKTKDILLNIPIPYAIGLSAPIQNIGNVENTGWDFTLDWQDVAGDFSYGVKVNLSDVKNKVTYLGGSDYIISENSITRLGSSIGLIYGYETAGIFQDDVSAASAPTQFGTVKAGNLQFKNQLTVDTNGDGIPDETDGQINTDDRVAIGNPFPRMTYGVDLNAGYKGFDASVSLQGAGKRDVLLGGDMVIPLFNAGKIQEWHVKECWNPENRNAKFPVLAPTSAGTNDNQVSSTWVFNAAYLRVRNIVVGYTLPKPLLNKLFINNVRIYFSGQNLLTFDKLPEGVDP
jgi:TonB-linked SusC/RagA family outer membrane protein